MLGTCNYRDRGIKEGQPADRPKGKAIFRYGSADEDKDSCKKISSREKKYSRREKEM